MAVQPDPRSRQAQLAEAGMYLVIEAESGPYVMCRFRRDERPLSYYLRDRRPGQRLRGTVWWSHLWQWSASPVDGVEVAYFRSAVEAWAALQSHRV